MSMRLEAAIGEKLCRETEARCFWWEGVWYSKEDFSRLVEACRQSLIGSGFVSGQRLCVLMQNNPMIPALSLAVWQLGGSFCPLNAKSGAASLSGTIELLEPFAIVLSEETRALLGGGKFPCVACPPMGPLPSFEGRASEYESGDIAVIFATSGTTGAPKAVPLTHGNIHSNCLGIREIIRPIDEGDVFLNVLPNFHSFGYTISTILPLFMDAAQAIVPGFMPPQATMRAIREAEVNVLFGVPAIFSYLLNVVERGALPQKSIGDMKVLISGGDRLAPEMHSAALKIFGKDIMEGYGLTETSPAVAISRSYEEYRQGTVGPFLTGYEWQLRMENGELAEENEGVLWVKSPSVAAGYFRAPALTAERFRDGWFDTGDYVRVGEGGYVEVLGRVTDIVIVGGFNVYPQEVEQVLHAHPAIETAIVIGMPHRVTGEVLQAFVKRAPDSGITEREVLKYCKEHWHTSRCRGKSSLWMNSPFRIQARSFAASCANASPNAEDVAGRSVRSLVRPISLAGRAFFVCRIALHDEAKPSRFIPPVLIGRPVYPILARLQAGRSAGIMLTVKIC